MNPQNMPDNLTDYYQQMQALGGWRVILESFARFVDPKPDELLLDIGCAGGALVSIFNQIKGVRAYGLDYDVGMLAAMRQAPDPKAFIIGALPCLPFQTGSFGAITATNVIYLLDDPEAALSEIRRLLKIGGQFAMLNPSELMNSQAATALADERNLIGFARQNFIDWGHMAESNPNWSAEEVRALFGAAGFELSQTRTSIGIGLARYAKGIKRG